MVEKLGVISGGERARVRGQQEQRAEVGGSGERCFRHETARMGEVHARGLRETREVEARVILKTSESVARAAAVRDDGGDDFSGKTLGFDVAVDAHGRLLGQRIGAGQEENFRGGVGEIERPDLGVAGNKVEAGAEGPDIVQKIFADHAHDRPQRIAGRKTRSEGEAAKQGDVDRGVELRESVAVDAEELGGGDGASAIEPLGGFKPVAKLAGVGVDAEVLQNEGKRAGGRVVFGQLVVVEIIERRLVAMADIEDGNGGIGEVVGGGLAALDGHGMFREENATGQELVFVRAAGMGENGGESRHSGSFQKRTPCAGTGAGVGLRGRERSRAACNGQ